MQARKGEKSDRDRSAFPLLVLTNPSPVVLSWWPREPTKLVAHGAVVRRPVAA